MKKTFLILAAALIQAAFAAAEDKPAIASSTAAPAAVSAPSPAAPPDAVPPETLLLKARELQAKDKKDPQPWVLMGQAYDAQGKRGKALSAFAHALKLDPRCADAYFGRGRVFEEKGDLDEAANEYQAALKANSSDAEAQAAWRKLSDRIAAADTK